MHTKNRLDVRGRYIGGVRLVTSVRATERKGGEVNSKSIKE